MVESLASLCAIALVLTVIDGKPTTTSLDIARHFGKRHDDVLRLIRNLLEQLPEGYARNFAAIKIDTDLGMGRTRQDPAYRITRDGFTLLAMGFTGKKALQFKLAYIDAFNRLEAELSSNPRQLTEPSIDVRAHLLRGQNTPEIDYPEAVNRAIEKQAWELSHDAYDLLREHMRRRVSYHHVTGRFPKIANVQVAIDDIKTVTLGQALAHTTMNEMRFAQSVVDMAAIHTESARQHIQAQIEALRAKFEGGAA